MKIKNTSCESPNRNKIDPRKFNILQAAIKNQGAMDLQCTAATAKCIFSQLLIKVRQNLTHRLSPTMEFFFMTGGYIRRDKSVIHKESGLEKVRIGKCNND